MMGVFINLVISKAVTKKEWSDVYRETLLLVRKFNLADLTETTIGGVPVICLERSKEGGEEEMTGWSAVGDYITMRRAEDYFLPKNLVRDNKPDSEAPDAIIGAISCLPSFYDEEMDEETDGVYHLWGAKTQGEPYHVYLLAIACLIADRLKEKAFVYGDITKGQCQMAVDMANQYLNHKIQIPDRCDMERLYARVSKLNYTERQKYQIFETFYLENQGAEFGSFCREHFSDEICMQQWKERLGFYSIDTVGFKKNLKKYLQQGYDLEKACGLINCKNEDGEDLTEEFITEILDTKLHRKEKDCSDILEVDQDSSQIYGVGFMLTQFFYGKFMNPKVDRYIPIEDIRVILNRAFSDKCNVDAIIDRYLEEEAAQKTYDWKDEEISKEKIEAMSDAEANETFQQVLKQRVEDRMKEYEEYDIDTYNDLIYYESGDMIQPNIEKNLKKIYKTFDSLAEEDEFHKLLEKTPEERCEYLAQCSRRLILRDKDWRKIFRDIKRSKKSFARYYPMLRIDLCRVGDDFENVLAAYMLNDDLYRWSKLQN